MSWGSEAAMDAYEQLWEKLREEHPDCEIVVIGDRPAPVETTEPNEAYL